MVSPLLTRFYVDWYAWALAGAPQHDIFQPNVGLCSNLAVWLAWHGILRKAYHTCDVKDEQDRLFRRLYGTDGHPFGEASYEIASLSDAMHLDRRRLDFVFFMIGGE